MLGKIPQTLTLKIVEQGQKKTVQVPDDGSWAQQGESFYAHHNDCTEFSWKPNLPAGAQQSVSEAVGSITAPERSLSASELASLPKGNWVAVTNQNQGLQEWKLLQVGDQPVATLDKEGKADLLDESAIKSRFSTPDSKHFSASVKPGAYAKYVIGGSKIFSVKEDEAAKLLSASQQAPEAPYGHIGVEAVKRHHNWAQKLAAGIAAPFALISLMKNPLG